MKVFYKKFGSLYDVTTFSELSIGNNNRKPQRLPGFSEIFYFAQVRVMANACFLSR
jgi:hypothetical protein